MELPTEVIAGIKADRKIAALTRLREHRGIDLKTAREIADADAC
jgi:hypothetical protein